MQSGRFPVNIMAVGLSLPTTTRPLAQVFDLEKQRTAQQLESLSAPFRERLIAELGLTEIMCDTTSSSKQRGREVAAQALQRAGVSAREVGLIIDYSTYAADAPALWSLSHDIQAHLDAPNALVLGTRGSGCCGLHLALRTAQAFLQSAASSRVALLVASDRAPDTGRVCLPIAVMSDAASALVVASEDFTGTPIARVRAVELQCSGRYVDILSSTSEPPAITIDAARFEQQLVPVHFVALNRVLARAMRACHLSISDISDLVYPNTTLLDRQSACRALGFQMGALVGPGPAMLGHAFANDLVINSHGLLQARSTGNKRYSAWLAAGSGFTWAAAIVETH